MINVTYRKGDSTFTINNRKIDVQLPIWEGLEVGGLLVLLLEDFDLSADDANVGRCVVAYDQEGNQVWRIEPFWYKVRDKSGQEVPDSYSQIRVGDDGKLYAYQPIGFICEIDIKTGKILSEHQTR